MTRFKTLAKTALCAAYMRSGAAWALEGLARRTGRRFMAILLFHRVTDQIPADGLTVSTARFRAICGMLRREFRVAPLADVFEAVRHGRNLAPRTVAVTFDDCYRDNLFAARVLADHGLPAAFFIPTAFVGTTHVFPWDHGLPAMPNLSWDEVREMAALGHEIGSHTVTHADLGAVPAEELRRELSESKRELEARLGRRVRWLAYPFGGRSNFRPEALVLAEEAGYEGCLSGYGGFVRPGADARLLPRDAAPCYQGLTELNLYLRGCLDWFYALKRWVPPSVDPHAGERTLAVPPDEPGPAAYEVQPAAGEANVAP